MLDLVCELLVPSFQPKPIPPPLHHPMRLGETRVPLVPLCTGPHCGGDTSIAREAPKEATKHYNLRRNARIQCHPYKVNNMLILSKKFKTLSLEDISISKNFEDMNRSKPMKMGVPPLNP